MDAIDLLLIADAIALAETVFCAWQVRKIMQLIRKILRIG